MTQKDTDTTPVRGHFPTQARGRKKYELILTAAKQQMLEQGVGGLKLADIASRAEVSMGAIYRYFPTKEDIVRLIAAQYFDQVGSAVFAQLNDRPRDWADFETMLQRIFRNYVTMLVSDPGAQGVFASVASDPELTARSRQVSGEHAAAMARLTSHLFPGIAMDELERRFYLSMIMTQPLVEAALALNGAARDRMMETGFTLLIAPYRQAAVVAA